MKRSLVYLALVLCLSVSLTGCLGRMDSGNVANSPAPAIESPAIPSPDMDLMPSSTPDASNRQTGTTEKQTPKNDVQTQPEASVKPTEKAR